VLRCQGSTPSRLPIKTHQWARERVFGGALLLLLDRLVLPNSCESEQRRASDIGFAGFVDWL
jgi:hypothetical protein